MGIVASYRDPKNTADMARLISVALIDALGLNAAGVYDDATGVMEFQLEDEDVAVVVVPADMEHCRRWREDAKRFKGGERIEWLNPDEVKLIAEYREAQWVRREQRERKDLVRAARAAAEAEEEDEAEDADGEEVVTAAYSAEDSRIGGPTE
jgi:hypothetical protein